MKVRRPAKVRPNLLLQHRQHLWFRKKRRRLSGAPTRALGGSVPIGVAGRWSNSGGKLATFRSRQILTATAIPITAYIGPPKATGMFYQDETRRHFSCSNGDFPEISPCAAISMA